MQLEALSNNCNTFYYEGIDVVYKIIQDNLSLTKSNGYFEEKNKKVLAIGND